jgi:hypothetical protein
MDNELLDTHIELKLEKSRDLVTVHDGTEIVSESTKDLVLGARRSLLRNGETVTDKGGLRGNGRLEHRIHANILHGAAEHDDGSETDDVRRFGLNMEPPTEIDPVLFAVLDGSGAENPAAHGLLGDSHTGPPPLSGLAVADDVALVKDDPLKDPPIIARMEMCAIVSGENHDRGPRIPTLSLLQGDDGKAAGLELLGPACDESRRAQNEGLERVILDETDGLKGLAETHVIGENATPADVCPNGFTV